jgi:succinate dehydrogenase / fumarate reductase membrane anchor subunit
MSLLSGFENLILRVLPNAPLLGHYGRTRGWFFVVAWLHRLTGLILVGYALVHIYTLSLLGDPERFDGAMRFYSRGLMTLLAFLLAAPVIFHALNGGRLILYELFGWRDDATMSRWVFGLSSVYVLLVGLVMLGAVGALPTLLFHSIVLIFAISLGLVVALKVRSRHGALTWKLQRLSGTVMIVMIPAHLFFMHFEPAVAHESAQVIARMRNPLMKLVDLILVGAVLYHAAYGLVSIGQDYLRSKSCQRAWMTITIAVALLFGWIGVGLVVSL